MITAGTLACARSLGEFGPILVFAGAVDHRIFGIEYGSPRHRDRGFFHYDCARRRGLAAGVPLGR